MKKKLAIALTFSMVAALAGSGSRDDSGGSRDDSGSSRDDSGSS